MPGINITLAEVSGFLGIASTTVFGPVIYLYRKATDIADRVQTLEGQVKSLPAASEWHNLSLEITQLRGDIKEIAADLRGASALTSRVEAATARLEQYLLEQK